MTANTLPNATGTLSTFLRDRRARLRPEPVLGGRRRTPGLRREEVATRAGVSVTWYTWLEQGRGGAPSDEVLERLARALELDAAAREVLFLLGRHRPPPLQPAPPAPVPLSLQKVLDAFPRSPALVKTQAWDIVAWNEVATAVLSDFAAMTPRERNLLRRMFGDPALRQALLDWEDLARFTISVFRMDVARAGPSSEADLLVVELQDSSADFRRLWAENNVCGHGVALKRVHHPDAGLLTLEYSTFAVDGADGLSMLVLNPVTPADAAAIDILLARKAPG